METLNLADVVDIDPGIPMPESETFAFPNGFAPGMTLRDYFASQAMIAIRSRSDHYAETVLAKNAYAVADAMMLVRDGIDGSGGKS